VSILVKCRGQFDSYLLSFSSTGSTCNSSNTSSFLLWSNGGTRLFFWKFSSRCHCFLSLSPRVQNLIPYRRMARANSLYTFIVQNFWTKSGLKVLFRIPSIWENFDSFCWISFHFHGKFQNRDIYLIFMDPCIVVWFSRNNQQDATL
jgi:hypothetical protein